MFGVVPKEYGKRRPRTPKTINCSCGKQAIKVEYGTYECTCGKAFQYQNGKLIEGSHYWNYSFLEHKNRKVRSFPVTDSTSI